MDHKLRCRQENSLTIALRTIIKQKDEISKKYKNENQQLQELLIKQQNLLNKLNEDNMNLNRKLQDIESSLNGKINSQSNLDIEELLEQNKSLQEQLLLSQYYGSKMLRELNGVKEKLKMVVNENK
ncbi:unnamed protein product [Brachionus calyciflorus]|uniref:Uncharacterized protein n=1 Tax=Brachionus calyciflorus TaxID=104777 RepID=A0A813PE01_9BILA|nr:unnamed protein product [Brachionus calyciflorus]